jgi:hypothetical protein
VYSRLRYIASRSAKAARGIKLHVSSRQGGRPFQTNTRRRKIKAEFHAQKRRLGHANLSPSSILGHPPARSSKTKKIVRVSSNYVQSFLFAVEVCAESMFGCRLALVVTEWCRRVNADSGMAATRFDIRLNEKT